MREGVEQYCQTREIIFSNHLIWLEKWSYAYFGEYWVEDEQGVLWRIDGL